MKHADDSDLTFDIQYTVRRIGLLASVDVAVELSQISNMLHNDIFTC